MKHIDLFSGIGGFALAVDTVWPNSEHIFCDNDPFCQQVIKKHWPNSKIYGDIKTITYTGSEEQRRLPDCAWQEISEAWKGCDILTGGFPCQPFSHAGQRRGTTDDRYLWPAMFRIIRDFKPQWIIAENVRGLLTQEDGMVFENVCLDLENTGYQVQAFIIPAVALGAPHRRDRVWIVAYSDSRRHKGIPKRPGKRQGSGFKRHAKNAADSQSGESGKQTERERWQNFERGSWNKEWFTVATELCRVDDGLPLRLDGFELTRAQHREQRIKALGNAIVPQIAIEIMMGIKASETES